MLPPAFLDDIRARVPLSRIIGRRVTWDLRKSNQARGDWWAPCPFHQEKTPSFHCDDTKGFYYCFGCQAKGDHLTFLREAEGLQFMDAVAALAAEAGVAMPERSPEARGEADRRTQLREVLEQAARWFRLQLQTSAGAAARDYLAGRGLDAHTLEQFQIGFAPDARAALTAALTARGTPEALVIEAGLSARPDEGGAPFDRFRGRIMFPIRDGQGRMAGFGGRAMAERARAKYLNSPETPLFDKGRLLYNLAPARAAVARGAALVLAEGYMDVIALVQAGFGGAVAPLGTAVTEAQLGLAWRVSPEPVVALDGDAAGMRAALRVMDLALPQAAPGRALRFALLPAGQDPDDLIRSAGGEAMAAVLDAARPLVDLLWQRETEGVRLDSPERRAALDAALKAAAGRVADEGTRAHMLAELRGRRDALLAEVGPRRRGRGAAPTKPRTATRASALVAQDAGESLLEGVVLAVAASHPELVPAIESRLERLAPADPGCAALLHDILAGTSSATGAEALARLRTDPHVRAAPGLGLPATAAHLGLILGNALDRLEAARAARAERARAEAELASGAADEGLTWRVAQIEPTLDAANRPEMHEAEADAARNSALLKELLVNPPRRGR